MENRNREGMQPPEDSLIITNLESYLPEDIITNKELEELLPEKYPPLEEGDDTDRIHAKVGIKERHKVKGKTTSTDLAEPAVRQLLENSPVEKGEKLLLAVGTVLNEDRYPSVAAKLMERLELTYEHGHNFENAGFDIGAACSGWTYGVHTAAGAMLARGYFAEYPYDKAIVVTSDTVTRILHRHDSDTRVLFGDASTATMIERETEENKGFRILRSSIATIAKDRTKPGSDKSKKDTEDVAMRTELSKDYVEGDENTMKMKGAKVYINGREYTSNFFHAYCEAYGIDPDEIDYFIPHQSNKRMIDSMNEEFLHLGKNKYGEEKMLSNIENVGNTVASSTPLCLFDFQKEGKFKDGDRIVLCSFGAGYTLGIVDLECKF
jgi:3-oxoacyl-[acyl-carrier-protein] synthase III